MADKMSVFIRSAHRPDVRAALGPDLNEGKQLAVLSSDPTAYLPRFSSCVEKEDTPKVDKKEISKDDKPTAAAPGGGGGGPGPADSQYTLREGSYTSESLAEAVYPTVFA